MLFEIWDFINCSKHSIKKITCKQKSSLVPYLLLKFNFFPIDTCSLELVLNRVLKCDVIILETFPFDWTIISHYVTQSFSSWMVGRICIMRLGLKGLNRADSNDCLWSQWVSFGTSWRRTVRQHQDTIVPCSVVWTGPLASMAGPLKWCPYGASLHGSPSTFHWPFVQGTELKLSTSVCRHGYGLTKKLSHQCLPNFQKSSIVSIKFCILEVGFESDRRNQLPVLVVTGVWYRASV